jgi:hypothetical protein
VSTLGERWLDKRACAEHFGCSVRSIELAMTEGLPYAVIFGRPKFQATDVEQWLERTGRLVRRGTLGADGNCPGDAANAPGPDTEGVVFDAKQA